MLSPTHQFADCSVDPAARELRRDGELVTLSPKVFDCLAYLIEHRERAVGRDELISAVWGRADVSDTLLGQTVLKARRAIGDTGNEQRMIRTVPRFGYRWVALLRPAIGLPTADSPADLTAKSEPSAITGPDTNENTELGSVPAQLATPIVKASAGLEPIRQRLRHVALAMLAATVIAAALISLIAERNNRVFTLGGISPAPLSEIAAAQPANRAAVLPLDVEADPQWAWLRLGLMDLIANRLSSAGQPVVPSDNVVALTRTRKGETGNTQALREATGASLLIVPRAKQTARGWRVQLSLRTADGGHREVTTENRDVIAATSEASDQLLALLGLSRPAVHDATLSLTELQQSTEAALLNDDFPTALRLIHAAPEELRNAPQIRLRLAQIEYRSGRMQTAREGLQTLLAQVPAEVDPVLRARILNGLGAVAMREERSGDAQAVFSEAVALADDHHQPAILGQAYTGLGAALASRGEYDAASADLSRARVALELAGDTLALGRVEANEGILDNVRGRYSAALPTLQRAVERFEQFGALNELFLTVGAQIDAHLALLDPNAALTASETAFTRRDQLDNPFTRNWMILQRARALAAVGRTADARRLVENLSAGTDATQTLLLAQISAIDAQLALAEGHAKAAAVSARVAVQGLHDPDESRSRAIAWLDLVRALRDSDQPEQAAIESEQFSEWASHDAISPAIGIYATLARAEQAWATNQPAAGMREYTDAFEQVERWAVPADVAAVAVTYAGALIGSGQTERASAIVGRIARWADRDFACAVLQASLYRALGQHDAWQLALSRAQTLAGDRRIPPSASAPPNKVHQAATPKTRSP